MCSTISVDPSPTSNNRNFSAQLKTSSTARSYFYRVQMSSFTMLVRSYYLVAWALYLSFCLFYRLCLSVTLYASNCIYLCISQSISIYQPMCLSLYVQYVPFYHCLNIFISICASFYTYISNSLSMYLSHTHSLVSLSH